MPSGHRCLGGSNCVGGGLNLDGGGLSGGRSGSCGRSGSGPGGGRAGSCACGGTCGSAGKPGTPLINRRNSTAMEKYMGTGKRPALTVNKKSMQGINTTAYVIILAGHQRSE